MPTPRLVAFDLDDTLAPSKSPIDARIGALLVALAERVEVAIISGGQLAQFTAQVVDRLPEAPAAARRRIHLLPTCGTQYYRLNGDGVHTVYAHALSDDEKELSDAISNYVDDFGPDFDDNGEPLEAGESDRVDAVVAPAATEEEEAPAAA